MEQLDSQLREQFQKIGKVLKYGTAGFRDLAHNMRYVSFRVGAFVAILNKTAPSKSLGVVMSASHNKIADNGVKIANFNGNMLQMEYQPILQKFVEQKELSVAVQNFKQHLKSQGKTNFDECVTVLIGGDTRPSTPQLLALVQKGVESQNGKVCNFQTTTTPQLQYYVNLYNNIIKPKHVNEQINMEEVRKQYWINFSGYFKNCAKYTNMKEVKHRGLDCANGVGGKIIPYFLEQLKEYLKVDLINNTKDELLNNKCGADFVKVQSLFPSQYEPKPYNSFASFDGDADRIVFFSVQQKGALKLIDGDRIGTVFTAFFKKITQQLAEKTLKINQNSSMYFNVPTAPTIGFVKTYYANYSSSDYLLKQFGMEPIYAATGVKYLHEKAQHFDIGIYFQANGHGTIIFKENFLNRIDALLINKDFLFQSEFIASNEQLKKQLEDYFNFVQFYYNACKLSNPAVGDAISNLLLFELALNYLNMDYAGTLSLYTDLKSKTSKVQVKNKQNLKTNSSQDKVIQPEGLQEQIEKVLQKYKGKKAFLRPSGTQDVLRLHVEAQTKQQVDQITREVSQIVSSHKLLN